MSSHARTSRTNRDSHSLMVIAVVVCIDTTLTQPCFIPDSFTNRCKWGMRSTTVTSWRGA